MRLNKPHKASEWLLALKADPENRELKDAFAQWFEEDSKHAEEWVNALNAYKLMGAVEPDHDKKNIVEFKPRLSRKWGGLAIAASLLLAVVMSNEFVSVPDYETHTGQKQNVDLNDGSQINMAADTQVNIHFSEKYRDVELVEGQAFFDVSHDTERPFRVSVGKATVSVLGTAFDINKTSNSLRVQVAEGRVSVQSDHGVSVDEILSVGDQLHIDQNGQVLREKINAEYVASWRKDRVVVNDRPAFEVVDMLKRYYDGVVVTLDHEMMKQPVTGVYFLSDPQVAMKAVAESIGADVYEISPWMLLISNS